MHFGALRLGWALPCYPPKQSDAAAVALAAPPAHAVRTSPGLGPRRPWEMGMEVCGSGQGRGTPTAEGRPPVPSARAGALATEGGSEKAGPAARPRGFPRVPRSPDPRAPSGVLLRMHLTPKLSAATRRLRWGNGGPERGRAGALTLCSGGLPGHYPSSFPPCPCQELQLELSWESARKRKRKLPSGQEGHWEWPQQAAYLARDLRLTLR